MKLVIEVDGERWHKNLEREEEREKTIKKHFQIIRFNVKKLINKEYQNQIDEIITAVIA